MTIRVLRQFGAILKKDWLVEYSYRLQFLLTVSGVFFQLATFFFVSKLVGPLVAPQLRAYGGDYFSFLAIGLAFGSYQWISLQTFSSSLREQQVMGTLEIMLASPIRPEALIIGSSLWSFLFATIEVLIYLVLGALVFGLNIQHINVLSAVVVIIMTILAMSAFGILSASFIMVFKRGDPVAWAFGTVSELLGGVYYPIHILPDPLQYMANALPITHSLKAIRLAVLQGYSVGQLVHELGMLAIFAVVLLPISLLFFRKAIDIARRDGTLSQY